MNTLTAVFGIALLAALLYTALKRSVPRCSFRWRQRW